MKITTTTTIILLLLNLFKCWTTKNEANKEASVEMEHPWLTPQEHEL
jgi:hypothetical protein